MAFVFRLRPVPLLFGALLVALVALCNGTAFAQRYNFRTYSTSDGLPQNVVLSLHQDSTGRLWIGTVDGLCRFDGTGFQNFGKEEGLTNTRVLSIFEESPTVFLFGTREGITRIDVGGPKPILSAISGTPVFGLTNVTAITRDKNGTYWFGASEGLATWDGKNLKPVSLPKGNAVVTAGLRDPDGTFWFGLHNELLRVESPENAPRMTVFGAAEGLQLERIRGLFRDSKGAIWVAGHGGLLRGVAVGATMAFRRFGITDGFPAENYYQLAEDWRGRFWVSTSNGATKFVVVGNPATAEVSLSVLGVYQDRNGLCDNKTIPVLIDRERNLWIGTHNGLAKLESERFVNFDKRDGLPNGLVFSVAADREGDLWIGTDKGLAVATGNRITDLTSLHPKLATGVRYLYRTRDGRMLAGCEDFMILEFTRAPGGPFSPSTLNIREYPLPLTTKRKQIYTIGENDRGDILVGTLVGLFRHDGREFRFYDDKKGLPGPTVFEIGRNQTGERWLGTTSGLVRAVFGADGEPTFSPVPNLEPLAGKTVGLTFRDSAGITWIATEGDGLYRWDGANLKSFTTANGLSNNVVNYILESPKGTLWISTNKGVDRYRDGKFSHFDDAEGFSIKGTDARMSDVDREGNLWFATQYGVVKYVSAEDVPFSVPPGFNFLNARIGGEAVTGAELDALRNGSGLSLGSRRNSLEFEFGGVSFVGENSMCYRWKLEGVDADWQPPTSFHVARYPNLPPGSYTFVAKAVNRAGLESEPIRLRFTIAPPFWQRAWFLLLVALAVGGSGFGLHRLRISAIERQKAELETTVAQRTAQLGEALKETETKNSQLEAAKSELEFKNKELDRKVEELEASNRQADRIFSALAQALPGTILDGKYRLDYKIGTGGFGAVFRGTHLVLNYAIAVKVFRPTVGNDSTNAVERFRREGIATCRVNHPNAVKVMDSGISLDGIAYIVMELLDGHSLAEELRRRPGLSLGRAAAIVSQICEALEAAHAVGIIHRDIKPDNIFLHETPEGEIVKVVDFGIAKLVGGDTNEDMETLTRTGGIVGTPVYMAPERLNGHPCDGKSDVYSVGVTLYQMLAGRVPFQSTGSGNMVSVILGHLNEKPRQLRDLRPDIPANIETIIMNALRKRPGDRPGAAEFGKIFADAVAELPQAARNFRPPVASGPDLTDMATIAPNEPGSVSRMPRSVDFPTWSGEGQRFAGDGSITADPVEPDTPDTFRGDELPTIDAASLPTLNGQPLAENNIENMPTWRGDELPTRDGLDFPTLRGDEMPTETGVRTQDSRLQTPDSNLQTPDSRLPPKE
jgi:serine/threonine protein kinase/ligand-binding sensor domain-containing protein